MRRESPQAPSHLPSQVRRLLEALAGPAQDGRIADVSAADPTAPVPAGAYSVVIGAVPFGGSLDAGELPAAGALARSRRAELLAFAGALLALKDGGRLALVVPESFLDGATRAHQALRRRLIEDNSLQAVIRLRAGVFKPRTRAAVVVAAKGGQTGRVWFCELGGAQQIAELTARWLGREGARRDAPVTAPSFFVRREDFQPPAYVLAADRFANFDAALQPRPHEILHEIAGLEAEILQGIRELVGMLK